MPKSSSPMQNENFRIIRSVKRKRAAIRIAADGIVEILVPQPASDAFAAALFKNNLLLINRLKARTVIRTAPDFREGAAFMLLGTPYPLHLTGRVRIFNNAFLVPGGNIEKIRAGMIGLYRELAAVIIRKRIELYQDICGATPVKVRISAAETRWGSCSSTKSVTFSWKLIQCPLECVDYVVVHELSHLKEMNHSTKFWQHVGKVIPDFRARRKLLNEFAKRLPNWDQKETLTSPVTAVGGAIN